MTVAERRKSEEDLLKRLRFLRDELEPYRWKFTHAMIKMRDRIRRDYDEYIEPPDPVKAMNLFIEKLTAPHTVDRDEPDPAYWHQQLVPNPSLLREYQLVQLVNQRLAHTNLLDTIELPDDYFLIKTDSGFSIHHNDLITFDKFTELFEPVVVTKSAMRVRYGMKVVEEVDCTVTKRGVRKRDMPAVTPTKDELKLIRRQGKKPKYKVKPPNLGRFFRYGVGQRLQASQVIYTDRDWYSVDNLLPTLKGRMSDPHRRLKYGQSTARVGLSSGEWCREIKSIGVKAQGYKDLVPKPWPTDSFVKRQKSPATQPAPPLPVVAKLLERQRKLKVENLINWKSENLIESKKSDCDLSLKKEQRESVVSTPAQVVRPDLSGTTPVVAVQPTPRDTKPVAVIQPRPPVSSAPPTDSNAPPAVTQTQPQFVEIKVQAVPHVISTALGNIEGFLTPQGVFIPKEGAMQSLLQPSGQTLSVQNPAPSADVAMDRRNVVPSPAAGSDASIQNKANIPGVVANQPVVGPAKTAVIVGSQPGIMRGVATQPVVMSPGKSGTSQSIVRPSVHSGKTEGSFSQSMLESGKIRVVGSQAIATARNTGPVEQDHSYKIVPRMSVPSSVISNSKLSSVVASQPSLPGTTLDQSVSSCSGQDEVVPSGLPNLTLLAEASTSRPRLTTNQPPDLTSNTTSSGDSQSSGAGSRPPVNPLLRTTQLTPFAQGVFKAPNGQLYIRGPVAGSVQPLRLASFDRPGAPLTRVPLGRPPLISQLRLSQKPHKDG